MSDLENLTKPVLKPLLRGHTVTLDEMEQMTLRAWIVPSAMVFEHVGTAPGAHVFYTQDERRAFGDTEFDGSLEPIDGSYIWAFQFRSSRWAARSNVAGLGLHMVRGGPITHRLQVTTGVVGRFGLQVLVGRWPKRRRLELFDPAVTAWTEATTFLSPDPPDAINWPPPFSVDDDGYEPVLDRFMKPGFPLQPRPRR